MAGCRTCRTCRARAERFAAALGARFVDADRAYDGLEPEALARLWEGVDGHWTQEGSDRFARLINETLRDWPPSSDEAALVPATK